MSPIVLILASTWLGDSTVQEKQAGPVPEIRVGQRDKWFELSRDDPRLVEDGPTKEIRLITLEGEDGKVTITVVSMQFDVLATVDTDTGWPCGKDDNGAYETNARLVLDLQGGRSYRLLVSALDVGFGEFSVDVVPGEQPPLTGKPLLSRSIAHQEGAIKLALERDDQARAARCLERRAELLRKDGRAAEAAASLEKARRCWQMKGDRDRELGVALKLGRLKGDLGIRDEAETLLAETLASFRALRNARGEANTLLALGDVRLAAGDPAGSAARFDEAREAATRSAEIEIQILVQDRIADLSRQTGDRAGELAAVDRSGDLLREMGRLDEGRDHHGRALAIARESHDVRGESAALADLGRDWLSSTQWIVAREKFKEALDVATRAGDPESQAAAHVGLGVTWFGVERYDKALEHYEAALRLAGENRVVAREANRRLALCYIARGEYDRARACLESERESAKRNGELREEADALWYLSHLELQAGHVKEARSLRRDAEEKDGLARTDSPLAGIRKALELLEDARFVEGEKAFRTCLEEARRRGNPTLKEYALWGLGSCLEELGRYEKAILCHREQLELDQALGWRRAEGEALERLGVEHRKLGALGAAREYLERALSISKETRDLDQKLDQLNGWANVLLDLEEYDEAVATYGQVREIAKTLDQPSFEHFALNNTGLAYLLRENWAESRVHFDQAVRGAIEFKDDPAILAEFQANLARALIRLGEKDQARELATESMKILASPANSEPRKLLYPLLVLTPLAIDDADLALAREHLDRATKILDDFRVQAQGVPGDVVDNPWQYHADWDRYFQDFVRARDLQSSPGSADQGYGLAEGFKRADEARARQLASGIIEDRRGQRTREAMRAHRNWKEALTRASDKTQEAALAQREDSPAHDVEALWREAHALREVADDLGRGLSPRDAALDAPVGAEPSAVSSMLPADTALIEYADGDQSLYVYVIVGSRVVLRELGQRREMDKAVEQYLKLVGREKSLGTVAQVVDAGQALFQNLLAVPLAEAGEGVRRIVVVPTPSLAVLPFEALVISHKDGARGFGDVEFVIDRLEVDYCPSASILVELSARKLRVGKLLILADPVYPSEKKGAEPASVVPAAQSPLLMGSRWSPDPEQFGRLEHTHEEALSLARQFVDETEPQAFLQWGVLGKQRSGKLNAKKVDLYLGSEATRARLEQDLDEYSILHLAAHGLVDGSQPRNTGIALAWSGSGEYEGFFSIADAAGLDLNANLVVLSACDTARGRVRAGEGVESLANAFLQSRARNVVASLWQVNDLITAETMRKFYADVGKGMTIEALRAAKLAIRRNSDERGQAVGGNAGSIYAHPYYWAPFIHIGSLR